MTKTPDYEGLCEEADAMAASFRDQTVRLESDSPTADLIERQAQAIRTLMGEKIRMETALTRIREGAHEASFAYHAAARALTRGTGDE